ncbi:hypothetical protein VNO77_27418 [Canavalia gladiata]|uniref:Uncharacterized protein n=1 Tax=Canavalia gladiata TaxID=3824 RepID=A0AAN9Q6G7_CANGL
MLIGLPFNILVDEFVRDRLKWQQDMVLTKNLCIPKKGYPPGRSYAMGKGMKLEQLQENLKNKRAINHNWRNGPMVDPLHAHCCALCSNPPSTIFVPKIYWTAHDLQTDQSPVYPHSNWRIRPQPSQLLPQNRFNGLSYKWALLNNRPRSNSHTNTKLANLLN